jgi:hypothetical protein
VCLPLALPLPEEEEEVEEEMEIGDGDASGGRQPNKRNAAAAAAHALLLLVWMDGWMDGSIRRLSSSVFGLVAFFSPHLLLRGIFLSPRIAMQPPDVCSTDHLPIRTMDSF